MKKITATQLHQEQGEYLRGVVREGRSFLVTKNGKPMAVLCPPDDTMVHIERDGTIRGEKPLTMRAALGGHY